MRRWRGFFLMDLLFGMGIALALLITMSVAVAQLHKEERQLADSRTAMRQLEAAALAMQNGGPADTTVKVERLNEAAGGRVWVRISSTDAAGKGRSLVALVPAERAGRVP